MILLLGATGYIGQAFADELRRRSSCFIPLSRSALDYTRFEVLFDYIRRMRPSLVINAAGYSGFPTIDACEVNRMQAFQGNALLPQTIARACLMTNTALGHVSSGTIYTGAKIYQEGQLRVERDLTQPHLQELFAKHPEMFSGFCEMDEPNATFRNPPCSFHSGTKALAEEALRGAANTYIWRCSLPFSNRDDQGNFLSQLQHSPFSTSQIVSLSHLGEFVRACLDLVDRAAPFGTYNVNNPGALSIRYIALQLQKFLPTEKTLSLWEKADQGSGLSNARGLRSFCILDSTKLLQTGIKMRPASQALTDALQNWQPICPSSKPQSLDPIPV